MSTASEAPALEDVEAAEAAAPPRPIREISALPDLLTPTELAEYLSVSKKTVYHWRNIGQGPKAYRLGKHIRFNKADVLAWVEASVAA